MVYSGDELISALDILHTQVIDHMGEEDPCLDVLQEAMDKLRELGFEVRP